MPKVQSIPSTREDIQRPQGYVAQIGGTHYDKAVKGTCPSCGFSGVQHWDLYAKAPYLEATASKYLTRWRSKGGIQDLRKAISVIEKIIAIEELEAATRAAELNATCAAQEIFPHRTGALPGRKAGKKTS